MPTTSEPEDRATREYYDDPHALAACWCGRDHLADVLDALADLSKPEPKDAA